MRFLVVGGLNTLLTYGIFLALCHLLPAWLGYGVAYVIGIGLSYCGNRFLVFRARDGGAPKWIYALLQVALLSLGSGITAVSTHAFDLGSPVAGFIALLLVTPCSYFLNKKYFMTESA